MTDSDFQPGMFVRYTHAGTLGIGKVIADGDRPVIEFWDRTAQRKDTSTLEPLSDGQMTALLWDTPQELAPWAKEKPLKLVALALSIHGGTGNPNHIKKTLASVPISEPWTDWWKKRAKKPLNELAKLPGPKPFAKSVKDNSYTLLCNVEDVPDDVQPPSSLADWKNWLSSEVNLPTFGKNPSNVLCESLAKWPKENIETTLNRILWGAGLLLASPKSPSAAAALAWMDAVGSAALRWSALNPDGLELTQRSGDVLMRLAQHVSVKAKRKEFTLFQAGALAEGPDRHLQLEQQRQEQERQRADYEIRLEQQRLLSGRAAELKAKSEEQERLLADHAAELKAKSEEQERLLADHAAELERERRKQERLRQQVRERNADLDAKREESRLEIRKDMLLAVGEVLQTVARHQGGVDELAGNVDAGLRLALRAGGADLLDTSSKGKVVAPGVIVRGGKHGDLVLLPAQVKHEAS